MRPLGDEVELAGLTHRMLTSRQLRLLGYTSPKVKRRLAAGDLQSVIPGVVSLDQEPVDFLTKAIALSLRYPQGFVSGPAAVSYWELRKGMPEHFEFTLPGAARPALVPFVQFRYSNEIARHDVFDELDGLRVSSPARAIFESAGRLDEFGLRSLVQDALAKGRVDRASLEEVSKRLATKGRRGTRLFRQVVSSISDEAPVQSEEELLVLDELRRIGVIGLVPQCPVTLPNGATVHVDVGHPQSRVGLEIDGPHHETVVAIHRDKSRDLQLAAVGWQSLRVPTRNVRRQIRVVGRLVQAAILQRQPTA